MDILKGIFEYKPAEIKFNFDELQKQIKNSVGEIQKSFNSSANFSMANFNLSNLNIEDASKRFANNLEDTTRNLVKSLDNVEKVFGGLVNRVVDTMKIVNGTRIGLPQIEAGKKEAITELKSFSDAVVEGISDLKDLFSSFKLANQTNLD